MQVVVLGTGSADGWPNAWCRCRSCEWARTAGKIRATTSVLIDGQLLIDCGPDTALAADRCGIGLAEVTTMLITHAHSDHLAPEALLARSWAAPDRSLRIIGPPTAIEICRPWIGPDDRVSFTVVVPGDVITLDGDREGTTVRVLAAAHDVGTDELTADAVLYYLTDRDGLRLVHAADTGPLPDETITALRDSALDLLLLEETFGTRTGHGTGHHDLTTFPRDLARLREVGAITSNTDVIAVHLSHHNPPAPELEQILGEWNVRVVDDGTLLNIGDHHGARALRTSPSRTLIVGGARSGKSHAAERLLAAEPVVRYVATSGSRVDDSEWVARVALHQQRRPATWTTHETTDLIGILTSHETSPLLIDCLSLWLAAQLDSADMWGTESATPARNHALGIVDDAIDSLVAALRTTSLRVVLVSNEVGSGVVPEHESGRLFRDLLGILNTRVGAECDDVTLVVAGRSLRL